jgi:hypothetical protein
LETTSVNVLYVVVLCWELCRPSEGRDSIHCSNVRQVIVRKEEVQERQRDVGDSRNEQRDRGSNMVPVIAFQSERFLVPVIRRAIDRRGQKYRQAWCHEL